MVELQEDGLAIVSQAKGYGLTVGLGVGFALVIVLAVHLQRLYLNENSQRTEMFVTANRSVGMGLTTSAVFSSWVWINEIVYCSLLTYQYGIALPQWWGAGLSFQIALMAALGCVCKIRVPYAHTSLEIVKTRYGRIAHVGFMLQCLMCNIFGCSELLFNGATVLSAMSGMHFVAASLLLPAGVIAYTVLGGLKATFITDFLHTSIVLLLMIIYTLGVLTSSKIGGVHGLYDKLVSIAPRVFIEGNYEGSLITFKSQQAAIWGVILKLCNLALVCMDSAFFQKAFASELNSVVPAYDLASLAIFAVPWGVGTVIGLSCRAIEFESYFPTEGMTAKALDTAMVLPYTVFAVLGPGAAASVVVILFMAVTSSLSSTFVGVSSIITFDLFRTYVSPNASDATTIRVTHAAVVVFGFFLAGFTIMLYYVNLSINWVNYAYGVLTVSGIIPLILTLFWRDQSVYGFVGGSYLGLGCGIGVWLGLAKYWYGEVSIDSTGQPLPCLYGCVASFFSPLVFTTIISLIRPQNFDWKVFLQNIKRVEDSDSSDDETESKTSTSDSLEKPLKQIEVTEEEVAPSENWFFKHFEYFTAPQETDKYHPYSAKELKNLRKWLVIALIFFVADVLLTFVLWPMPLYRNYIFTKPFFTGWVVVAIFWQFFGLFSVVLFPIYDGRRAVIKCLQGLYNEIKGKLAKSNK